MINLPAIAESTLSTSLEGVFGSEVVLTGPDGEQQTVRGQVTNEFSRVGQDSRGISHGGRNSMTVYRSVVVLRRSSLSPVPENTEEWTCRVPIVPGGEPAQTLFVEEIPDGSRTFGMLTLRLTRTKQI